MKAEEPVAAVAHITCCWSVAGVAAGHGKSDNGSSSYRGTYSDEAHSSQTSILRGGVLESGANDSLLVALVGDGTG